MHENWQVGHKDWAQAEQCVSGRLQDWAQVKWRLPWCPPATMQSPHQHIWHVLVLVNKHECLVKHQLPEVVHERDQ